MRAAKLPGALALAVVLLGAAASASAAIQTVIIGELYDGGTVNLGAGDTLEVNLQAPPSGCAWVPAFVDATILKPDPASAAPKFRYRALVAGSTSLGLACLKSSDPQAPPGGLFRVQVVVKDSVLPRGLLLEEPDGGSDIFLTQGDVLQVKLPSTPSTGYSWVIAGNAPSVLRPTGDPKYDPPAKGSPGAGGTQTFEFRVVGGGGAFLDLVYRRPFEKDAPPARRWSVFVASAAVGP
ncbi:MAG TPA: protease inhibitor I42 family protein [Thermoanaerobaculia bacterium]|nr:protease inhibitor I42 family protein [Thermoanaerobaculia bacterium]